MSGTAAIVATLAGATGHEVTALAGVSGGYINDAYRAELDDGRSVFVKTLANAEPGTFATEAAGLEWLRVPGGARVPQIVCVVDDPALPAATRLIALDWIDFGALSAGPATELGRGLAQTHAAGAPAFGFAPGPRTAGMHPAEHPPLRLGHVELPNYECDTWAEFYAECRVMPLVRMLRDDEQYDDAHAKLFADLCRRLPQLSGPMEPPARLHGDLWSGNVHVGADGHAYLIDPVAHGGHREFDIALLRLFGSPGDEWLGAYNEVAPLATGWQDRETLWAIVPILWHAVLLGGGYAAQALTMAKHYL